MGNPNPSDRKPLFSIGHSNHPMEVFLSLLKANEIDVLADTRSRPYSRFVPHFSQPTLKSSTVATGLQYLYLGNELGGRPQDPEFYDAGGRVLYSRVAQSARFRDGVERLKRGMEKFRVALLCAEENPAGCHRKLLIGKVLGDEGIGLLHIRADGRLQTEEELQAEEEFKRSGGQLTLFEVEGAAE